MSDYQAIVSTLTRLMRGVDTTDRALFQDSWAENVDFEVTFFEQGPMSVRGRDELVSRFTASWKGEPAKMRHQIGAIDVELLAPNRATARFYCTYINVGNAPSLAGMGEYEDELEKGADGRWRVAKRRHRFLTPLAH